MAGALAAGLLALLALLALSPAPSRAESQGAEQPVPTAQTDASLPAKEVTMIGSSPREAPNETWGLGVRDGAAVLVRYSSENEQGWSQGPALLDSEGKLLSGFALDRPEAFQYDPSPLAGQMTEDGSGVLAGTTESGKHDVLLTRDPAGSFKETAALPTSGEAALGENERLFGVDRAPMVAAIEEPAGSGGSGTHAGAFVVPVNEFEDNEHRVLHWNGEAWSSEAIEIPAQSSGEFQVLAMAASSPQNAWLLAKLSSSYPEGSVALFRRHPEKEGSPASWQLVTPEGEPEGAITLPAETAAKEKPRVTFTVPGSYQSQILTVTGEGVWLDGVRQDTRTTVTAFFKPSGESSGEVIAAFCSPSTAAAQCAGQLPEQLSIARNRSFAWSSPAGAEAHGASLSGHLGQRIITGFTEGVSLRLNGTSFERIYALGGGEPNSDVGGSFGSAFSSPTEGWLGQATLPVHLTTSPAPDRLTPWPTSFSRTLLALAPDPGEPVGGISSEALAVGERGEVARYKPGEGWLPESLLGPGGRKETPLLRSVAWPTTERAYAVGDRGAMWLWRGETGLWEPDPAAPLNFDGNLLSIAFESGNSSRGYAVGQAGVLLRYGKTWTQEPEENIPPQARGATFTSVAFAGSEAIVAYRRLIPSTEQHEGGLIVNSGFGWTVDEGAAAAIGSSATWAVAALPDGAAAFTDEAGGIYVRESAGGAWQATPAPYPGGVSPGSIALFRENGALRVIGVGSVPATTAAESEPAAPPGFPSNLVPPLPIATNQERGMLRQTATGWSDQQHELNNVREGPGDWEAWDMPYQPDPVAAVLVDETGTHGWAVGGLVNEDKPKMNTADVWRYPSEGPGVAKTAAVETEPDRLEGSEEAPTRAVFAIGGGAQCAAPCAALANAKIGPDVWLKNALSEAASVTNKKHAKVVRAFFYTGPRVTSGKTSGPATRGVPLEQEEERYAQILRQAEVAAEDRIHAFSVVSPTDLTPAGGEELFAGAFGDFPQPFGGAGAEPGLAPSAAACTAPTSTKAYAIESAQSGGTTVRVIALDNARAVSSSQLEWLSCELASAAHSGQPAIVIGSADVPQQVASSESNAEELASVLVGDRGGKQEDAASAYFFDSPEQNLQTELQHGGKSIPAFGSGTLGYINFANEELSDFIGASGFLLAEVHGEAAATTNIAPVTVRLIPDIEELAIEANQGTLLRRSNAARFQALARRPRSGSNSPHDLREAETDPYIPIPAECVGVLCEQSAATHGIFPEYSFSSSKPDIGAFVKPNLASPDPLAVSEGSNGKPISEEKSPSNPDGANHSGLFCAFNKGETVVRIATGGLEASLPVTVQAGSPRQPCGTVLFTEKVPKENVPVPTPAPAPSPAPAPASAPPPLPAPPAAAPVVKAVVKPVPVPALIVPPFITQTAPVSFVPPFLPPPVPTPARPTPPSGTSAVEAVQREEEEEAAPESVSNEAVAYRGHEHEPDSAYLLGLIVLAAFAGASLRGRPGRRGRQIRIAPATLSSIRTQRRNSRERRDPWR